MEAIALIIGELIFAILAPFIAIVVEAVGAAISALIGLLSGKRSENPVFLRITRLIAMALAALAGVVFACILVINFFFFEDSARFVLGKVETRAGIATECEDIGGSLLFGRVDLRNCSIRRPVHPSSSFELDVGEVSIDLRITSLLGTATLDTARVVGLSGWVRADRSQAPEGGADGDRERPRREFEVIDLQIADARVSLSGSNPDGNRFDVPIEIERVEVRPLRSRFALFDILFRSNASGSLAGAPVTLSSSEVPDGRRTEWRADKVPIASFGSMTGGILSWFSSGYVDVYVDDEWQRSDATAINMDWNLRFSDIEVAPPPGTGRVTRFVTAPLTRYVNSFDGDFPLEFEMVLNEDQFLYQSSLAAAGVWSAIGEAANNALSVIGINLESPEKTGDSLKEGMKSILERARKPKGQDEN
ncbi:MAG: hypothetical protein QNJ05_01465 [Woeseiaceae bacterium]|nr:hypothetical protein [Woeseiaceae bacterium]